MEKFDIVKIVESNPIKILSIDTNYKLINKIKKNFTDMQQQLFITSLYTYLNYDKTDFVIDLDNIWKWMDFKQKNNSVTLLKTYFKENKDYKLVDNIIAQRGGQNKKTYLLNINTFKLFCMKAGTQKSNEIHEYYIKLEDCLQEIIIEDCLELKKSLENKQLELNNATKTNQELIKDNKLNYHNILLQRFGTAGNLIYLIIVKTFEDGKYILKIGHSEYGIKARFDEHKTKYEECLLLECYLVKQSKKFETFIHHHELIAPSKYKELNGHETENELFLIGFGLTLAIVKEVINKNIKSFDDYDPQLEVDKLKIQENILKLEIEKIKLLTANPTIALPSINNEHIENLINKTNVLEKTNNELKEQITKIQTKTATGFNQVNKTVGPKLQKINPETMQLIKVYDSIAECIKENPKLKRSSIAKAITNNTIYQGFRYVHIDRNLDSNVLHNVQPTKKTKIQNNGYIAKLSADKQTILNVYLDRKSACKENGYTSDSSLDNPVKNCKFSNGHYYVLYDSCSDELKKEFVKKNNNKEPVLYITGVGQFDDKNKLLQEFVSKFECCRLLGVGDKSVKKSIENNVLYNGKYYKYLESKVKCF